jgi:L-malate glycosyltransferase
MKIGIVLYPTFGGSGVVATELGKALAQKGNEVHFISYSQPVRLVDFPSNVFYHEVTMMDYPLFDYAPYELALTSKLVDVVRFEKLDILHVHYAIPHASAAYMAQHILKDEGINIPFVTTLHGTDITLVGRDSSYEPVITFAINHSNAVTTVSESLKKDTYAHFKITKSIEVIPNFICLESYPQFPDAELKKQIAPMGEKIVLHVSNFRKVKRVEDVVKIFHQIRQQIPAKLVFVGDGPERHNAESLCRELGVCNDMKFYGKIKDVEKFLGVADLFLLPSETESFGLAALEAMACSVPVISSSSGGLPEVNEHGFSGFLAPVGDVEAMAHFGMEILKNDSVHQQFKQNARKQAEKFQLKTILPLYEKLYEELISSFKIKHSKF